MKLRYYIAALILASLQIATSSFGQGLIIPSGAYVVATNSNIVVCKNWVNNGTFAQNGGVVLFNKAGAQTISGSSATAFDNLTIGTGSVTTISAAGQGVKGILLCNDTLNAGGNLTLLSTSAQTALINGTGTGQVLGNVKMQRYLDSSFGYRIISSPFQVATIGQLSAHVDLGATFTRFYKYNEDVAYSGWIRDTVSGDTLQPMHGYSANFGAAFSNTTFSLNGVVSNGTVSYTLYNHNNPYTLGYNLVSNPYPSPIDWTASTGWTKTNIDNAIYYFHHGDTNQYYGSYSSYIGGISSDGVAGNIIPAMQGFFVHVTDGSYPVTGTLACTNAVRTTNLSPYFHKPTGSGGRPLIRIDAGFANGTYSDPTVVYFDDRATPAFDRDFDALKLMNTDASTPSLYSVSQDNNNMSIQALPELADSSANVIPLGINTENDGEIVFKVRGIESVPEGMHIYFLDAKTGTVQDLQSAPRYGQYLDKGKYENRFFLMYTYREQAAIPGFSNDLTAYASGYDLYVYLLCGTGDLFVTNMLGQVVLKSTLTGNGYHKVRCPFAAGIYVATLFSTMGKQSKKVFIGE